MSLNLDIQRPKKLEKKKGRGASSFQFTALEGKTLKTSQRSLENLKSMLSLTMFMSLLPPQP